jgi:hypothetical protein
MADPHIEGAPAALSDEQRENVRNILARFGGMVEEKEEVEETTVNTGEAEPSAISTNIKGRTQEDLLKGALSGVTLEWSDLTSETMKYSFIKEVCCQIEPFIRDKIEVTPAKFKYICHMLGVTPHNASNTLISCAVEQADPITMFHIQVELKDNGNMVIQRVRFIV